MMLRPPRSAGWLAVPALAAIWPVLFIAGSNPGEFSTADLMMTAILAAISGLVCAAIALAITRRTATAAVGGVVLVAAMYAPLLIRQLRYGQWLGLQAHGPTVPVLLGLIILLALIRLRVAGDRVRPALLPMALAISTLVLLGLGQSARSLQRSAPAAFATAPTVVSPSDALPDIYLIVLDQYATAEVMRRLFQFDNRRFEDSLRAF